MKLSLMFILLPVGYAISFSAFTHVLLALKFKETDPAQGYSEYLPITVAHALGFIPKHKSTGDNLQGASIYPASFTTGANNTSPNSTTKPNNSQKSPTNGTTPTPLLPIQPKTGGAQNV